MGSVLDRIECPNCKREATLDFYYKTGEEFVFCGNCGYNYSSAYKRNEDGRLVTKDGTDNYNFDNLILETNEIKNPYGAYTIKHYQSIGRQMGSLQNEDAYYELIGFAQTDENVEFASVSMLVDGEIVGELLVDRGPKVDGAGFTEEDNNKPF
jgi:Zn ribbon nucleic-acid-binding protein